MLKKLTPNLMVEDVQQTISFYQDVLGFEVLTTVPGEADRLNFAIVRRDDVELMFQSRESLTAEISALVGMPIAASQTFYIEVSGIRELYGQLKERVEIVSDMHSTFYGTEEFYFRDCNGYILSFSEAVRQD